jgi:hypothetical protein
MTTAPSAKHMKLVSESDLALLRDRFSYDKETGIITRVKGNRRGPLSTMRKGYLYVQVLKRDFYAHRVAWFLSYGYWPTKYIDHIDGDKTNNRLFNLREADPTQNQWNAHTRRDNATGFKGVSLKQSGKWQASITIEGRYITLGTFASPEEAHQAYCAAANRHFGEYANHGSGPMMEVLS